MREASNSGLALGVKLTYERHNPGTTYDKRAFLQLSVSAYRELYIKKSACFFFFFEKRACLLSKSAHSDSLKEHVLRSV